jgi:hypothetical protein
LSAVDGTADNAQASVLPFAAATGVLWLVGAGLSALLLPEGTRGPVLAGALAALVSGAVALGALAVGVKHGTNGLLAGFGVGFFARLIAVAVGLLASGAQGRSGILSIASFFGFYALTQAIEIAFVWAQSRARRAVKVQEHGATP